MKETFLIGKSKDMAGKLGQYVNSSVKRVHVVPGNSTRKSGQHGCENPSLMSLFFSFLKLGATAFGGPAMVPFIGKMAVEQRKWLDGGTFHDGVALCQMIPGATAMQVSAYVGFQSKRSGWRGSELHRIWPSRISSHGWAFGFLCALAEVAVSRFGV